MVPKTSRQLLVWSLPTIAFLLSLLWYRRKRSPSLRSDPGGTIKDTADISENQQTVKQDDVPLTTSPSTDSQLEIEKQCEVVAIVNSIALEVDKSKTSTPDIKDVIEISAFAESNLKENTCSNIVTCVGIPAEEISNSDTKNKTNIVSKQKTDIDEVIIADGMNDQDLGESRDSVVEEEAGVEILHRTVENSVVGQSNKTNIVNSSSAENKTKERILENNTSNTCIDGISLQKSTDLSLLSDVDESTETEQRTAFEENCVQELEVSLVNYNLSGEETTQVLNCSIQQDRNEDSGVNEELNTSVVNVFPLDKKVYEGLKLVVSVDNDAINFAPSASDSDFQFVQRKEEALECKESVSCVASSFVTEALMAHKSSVETSTEESGAFVDENSMKTVEMSFQVSDSVSLECKLSTLELDSSTKAEASSDMDSVSTNGPIAEHYAPSSEQRTERDSANHSPADVMLASPSISSYSDAQSEGSSDSGKGCSDVATPPSRTPASGSSLSGDTPLPSVYEFVLPQHLVGRLIGRHGGFVHQIKAKTNASILIKRHPDTQKLKICAVEGAQADIESALEMIRQKFPAKRYPNVTLEQVSFLPPVPTFPLIPEYLQLQLIEGVNNDVILSSLVSPAHFFLQQPTHPTFPSLNRLNACMNLCYSEPTAPQLPMPTQAGVICVAPTMGGWYRAQVVGADSEADTCDIKFVDYGGYLTLSSTALRQIRSDFMTLPFQAAECYLACVMPVGGEEALWNKESIAGMEELTHGQVLQVQVVGYAEDGLPVVYLYANHGSQVILVNQELVARGLAEWVDPAEA